MIVGIGLDLVEIDRVQAVLERTPSVLDRLWTPDEQRACAGRIGSLASRFAAKEAVAKALGTGIRGFAFLDVEVVSDDLGRPSVRLHPAAAAVAAARGVAVVHLSLTTTATTAGAYAVAEGTCPSR